MGTFTEAAKNTMLDALSGLHLSLHTGDPGSTGANEVTGGSYARQPAAFDAADAGSRALSGDETFAVPGSTTVTHVGIFDALTDGNFLGVIDTTDEAFAADGQMVVRAASTSLDLDDPA
ncbi:phage tail fiber protein [Euryhalocaulis caribicus]|uniref:phage tail fiber protein n=1 Tax=Euryhalocaulis caribicus TaxID=1161401 RepID=UPI0003A7994D|nr:hypothetical protein [Euryhalocaulis caribicus]